MKLANYEKERIQVNNELNRKSHVTGHSKLERRAEDISKEIIKSKYVVALKKTLYWPLYD